MLRRGLEGAIATAVAASILVVAACGNNGIVTYEQPFDASIFADHYVPPTGVGGACGEDRTCRTGLTCGGDGACVPGYSTPTNAPCEINDECIAGDYCGGLR